MDKKLIVFVVFALLISSIWLLIYLHGKAEERNSSLTVEQWIDAGKEMFYVKLNAEIQLNKHMDIAESSQKTSSECHDTLRMAIRSYDNISTITEEKIFEWKLKVNEHCEKPREVIEEAKRRARETLEQEVVSIKPKSVRP
jgi:hypothetical protein